MIDKIRMDGEWYVSLKQNGHTFAKRMMLPGTTEQAQLGEYAAVQTQTLHLTRKYPFTGTACYQREIEIPKGWENDRIFLYLERSKYTNVYVDEILLSHSENLMTSQIHELTGIKAGIHMLRIDVDNDLTAHADFPPEWMNGHQFTDETQTNWNGITGEMYLYRTKGQRILLAEAKSDWEHKKIKLSVTVENVENTKTVYLKAVCGDFSKIQKTELLPGLTRLETELYIEDRKRWDEFSSEVFFVTLKLYKEEDTSLLDEYQIPAAFMDVCVKEKQIYINEIPVFLRGTVDCAIYPKTAAAPTQKEEWRRIFKIYKEYGLNHCRFHSWCPPEAAFAEADLAGIYLQVELPNFAAKLRQYDENGEESLLFSAMKREGIKILQAYANHPSFLMFAGGNEMLGDIGAFEALVDEWKKVRPDKLIAQGANNFLEDPLYGKNDDYWVIMRTDQTSNIRASFSHGDLPLGHLQSKEHPNTEHDYKKALMLSPYPLISHEIGQYQTFPRLSDRKMFAETPLEPSSWNVLEKNLKEKGLEGMDEAFFDSSKKLAALCYREDIEAALRTPKMSGFQLLGIQDFPGQGTALVGMLDSFYESKDAISKKEWRQFCAPAVLLAKFESYTVKAGECLEVTCLLSQFSDRDISGNVSVYLETEEGCVIYKIEHEPVRRGRLCELGKLKLQIPKLTKAQKAKLRICSEDETLETAYPIWIYPDECIKANKVFVTDSLDEKLEIVLKKGGKALLCSSKIKKWESVPGFFASDFWCYPMFEKACVDKGMECAPGTMGILADSAHPALKLFPTEAHSNWQWHDIVMASAPAILNEDDIKNHSIQMIVRVIDNFSRNHSLGLIWEMKCGEGSLLICAADLLDNRETPEVNALLNSLISYMEEK